MVSTNNHEYVISTDAPRTIIITGEGAKKPFVEHLGGKIIDSFDGELCEIPFTSENAQKLREFLTGKDFLIPPREKTILKYLADNPDAIEDKEIRWNVKLTDLIANKIGKRFSKIHTEWDLLHYFPLRYLDKSNPQKVSELILNQWAVIAGTVVSSNFNQAHNFTKIVVQDITGQRISATFFRQKWLSWKFKEGDEVVLYGNYSEYTNKQTGNKYPQITNASINKVSGVHNETGYGMVPIYPQKSEDKSWQLKIAQEELLEKIIWIEDPVPAQILKKYDLPSRTEAFKTIHFPKDKVDVERARRRIAFDEFVRLQIYIQTKKTDHEIQTASRKTDNTWSNQFVNSLPFNFTDAQKRVTEEIREDLQSNTPMYRLLQGDVGSGKAQPLYSKILTPTGWTTMGEIQPGDTVLTPTGTETVLQTFLQHPNRPVYEFTYTDGSTVKADENHLWVVYENESFDSPHHIVTTSYLLKTYKNTKNVRWYVPTVKITPTNDIWKITPPTLKGITNIAHTGEEQTKCILISGENHLYITDNGTVTHNTELASAAVLTTVKSGYQAAMLAPTDILANQLHERLEKTFKDAGLKINTALFTGKVLGKKRKQLLEDLENGVIDVVVGTHTLTQDYVQFENLGLAVVDEQHKYGSEQRTALKKTNKDGSVPDMLAMSATPIPRTTSQVLYGDMDISIVDELPAERLPIETFWNETPDRAWAKIREEVEAGHKAYVVAALVEDSDKDIMANVESATSTAEELQARFPNFKVGLLHGKMNKKDKEVIANDFIKGDTQILVATSLIEVGLNNPDATVMAILNANRFGIASLHQIRGRVGRGKLQSYCYLVGEATMPEAEERLNALVASNDGFWLAEKDLEIRGEGSLFGKFQSGSSDLYIANLKEHKDLLGVASRVAKLASKNPLMNHEVKTLYKDKTILG